MLLALLAAGPLAGSVPVDSPPAAASGAGAGRTHHVRPGGRIQPALDRARPGDVVVLHPGTYREAVRVAVPRVRIEAVGARLRSPPAPPPPCGPAGAPALVCVAGRRPVRGVAIVGLTVTDAPDVGLAAHRAPGLLVWGVTVRRAGGDAIRLRGVGAGRVRAVLGRGNRGAGIAVAGPGSARLAITGVSLVANGVGLDVDGAGPVILEHSDLRAGCLGVRVRGAPGRRAALAVVDSVLRDNGRSCPPGEVGVPDAGLVVEGPVDLRRVRTVSVRNVTQRSGPSTAAAS